MAKISLMVVEKSLEEPIRLSPQEQLARFIENLEPGTTAAMAMNDLVEHELAISEYSLVPFAGQLFEYEGRHRRVEERITDRMASLPGYGHLYNEAQKIVYPARNEYYDQATQKKVPKEPKKPPKKEELYKKFYQGVKGQLKDAFTKPPDVNQKA